MKCKALRQCKARTNRARPLRALEDQMTRHLFPQIVLLTMGFSAEALADTDITIDSDISEVVADDSADKKARKSGSKPARSSASKAKPKPAKPASSNGPAKKPAQPTANKPQTAKPKAATPPNVKPASPASNARQPVHGRPHANPARPAPHRPSAKSQPGANARPAHPHQVRRRAYVPPRWTPSYHRYHLRGVPRHHPRYWSAGVFYYNPPPARHKVVVVNDGGNVARGPQPTSAIDRNNTFGVGITSGSYNSGYKAGGAYGDMGIGLTATYRPVEAVGFELAWTHYDQSWEENSERIHEPVQASVNLYAFPWTRVSPYVTLGLTQTGRDVQDTWFDGYSNQTTTTEQTVFGPHAGMGLEFALGSAAAVDLEARYISYLDVDPSDASASSAVQGTMGLKFYF